jgi:hypothetical protein
MQRNNKKMGLQKGGGGIGEHFFLVRVPIFLGTNYLDRYRQCFGYPDPDSIGSLWMRIPRIGNRDPGRQK